MSIFQIVPATLVDAPALVILSAVLGYPTEVSEVEKRLAIILNRKDHCLLVAKAENEVVGFCHGYALTLVEVPQAVEIGGVAVLESWQSKGVAKKLVTGIEDWTRQQGYPRVVLKSNIMRTKAHGFYEHIGYTKTKQQYSFEKRVNPDILSRD